MSGDIVSFYRERLAKETGTIKKDWGGKLAVALAYPNYYRLGMSNLGFQVVYQILNMRAGVVAERVFLPEDQEMSLYLQSGRPLLSLESQTRLDKFHLVAFSLSFENDYQNLLKILELGKIGLLSEERGDSLPLIMAGGITTFLNPEPLASFVDFFLFGEAEAVLDECMDILSEMSFGGAKKIEILSSLARNISSLYVPSFYEPQYHKDGTIKSFMPKNKNAPLTVKVRRRPADCKQISRSLITTPDTEFGDKILVELGRGCGRSCRFCAAGFVYRPPRFNRESDLISSIEDALKRSDKVGLLAAAVSDIPGIENVTSLIVEKGDQFSVSSLRADSISREFLDNLKKAGQRTITIAPEAGSKRLRMVINKHLPEEKIVEAVIRISEIWDFSLRLYFLIGLPTEVGDDVRSILDLVKTIKHHMVKASAPRGRMGKIKLSVNCFIPKPFTPFQWFPMDSVSSLKEKQKWLRKAFGKLGGIGINHDVPKWAYVQTLLSMGDRRVGPILLKTHQLKGNWSKALRFSEVNPDFFVYRPKGLDELLPWDFIENGVLKKYLVSEYKLALKSKESDICHVGECFRCGVCG